jgi:hypothetical protein
MKFKIKFQDFLKGKQAKGTILLISCSIERTLTIKDESFAFIINQIDGRQYLLCANSEKEMQSWYLFIYLFIYF